MATKTLCSSMRRGISLLEVLIVIAIIGVLIAVLLPAIQRIRESAIRTQCANNLKQLGIAALNYEGQQKHFAPGYIGPMRNSSADVSIAQGDPQDNQWVGHLPMLLPLLEQGALWEKAQVNFDVTAQTPPWWEPQPSLNYQVAAQQLPVFLCPADFRPPPEFKAGSETGSIVGVHFYNTGPFLRFYREIENYDDGSGVPYDFQLARTNYIGVGGGGIGTAGNNWWAPWVGIYTNRSANTVAMILDGTSNTLLYGESAGRADMDVATGTQRANVLTISWFGGGAIPSNFGVARGEIAFWYQFSSMHPGGVQFCFADGSVRLLSFATSDYLLMKLSGMRDNLSSGILD